MRNRIMKALGWGLMMGALIGASNVDAQIVAGDYVTYSSDVATIINENCVTCHRAGGIGPMELVTYQDARRYARRIKEAVVNRIMPPYYYDNDVSRLCRKPGYE